MSSTSKLSTWLVSPGKSEFDRAETLRKVVDPESTPFKSKYEAVEIYQKLYSDLEQLVESEPCERLYLLQLGMQHELAFIHMDTEDLASAERCLQQCIDLVRSKLKLRIIVKQFNSNDEASGEVAMDGDANEAPIELSLLFIQLYNQLGFLKSMKLNFEASEPFLKAAESIFFAWEKAESKVTPLTIKDLFHLDRSASTLVELAKLLPPVENTEKCDISKAHTMTIYYLAQAYQQTAKYAESARYCHLTLRAQYRYLGTGELNVDHIEWSLNAATLSQYFSANEQYHVARHLMGCARKVWRDTDAKLKEAESERWQKAGADLDRIEVKYCLLILDESFRLMAQDKMKDYPVTEWKFNAFLLNDPEVAEAEEKLPTFPVRDYAAAKSVVKYALGAIESAKKFFTITERASDFVDCTFDHSSIFGSVVPFEPEIDNRCKMIKRRIDMLEGLITELNPQFFLQHCRKIHYELGDIYSQQVSLKYAAHEAMFAKQQAALAGGSGAGALDKSEVDRNVAAMRKINQLVVKSIQHYHKFLSSFECLNTKEKNPGAKMNESVPFEQLQVFDLPNRIESNETDGYLQAIVTSYLSIGRLYIKIVTSVPQDRVRYWIQCEKYYKALKQYLTRNDDQRVEFFEDYSEQLDEMLALIPGKIQQILSQSVY